MGEGGRHGKGGATGGGRERGYGGGRQEGDMDKGGRERTHDSYWGLPRGSGLLFRMFFFLLSLIGMWDNFDLGGRKCTSIVVNSTVVN